MKSHVKSFTICYQWGNNSLTECISAFLDEQIKILVPKIRNIEKFRQTGHYFLPCDNGWDITIQEQPKPRRVVSGSPVTDKRTTKIHYHLLATLVTIETCTLQKQFQVQRTTYKSVERPWARKWPPPWPTYLWEDWKTNSGRKNELKTTVIQTTHRH